jgi:hypothetical protein
VLVEHGAQRGERRPLLHLELGRVRVALVARRRRDRVAVDRVPQRAGQLGPEKHGLAAPFGRRDALQVDDRDPRQDEEPSLILDLRRGRRADGGRRRGDQPVLPGEAAWFDHRLVSRILDVGRPHARARVPVLETRAVHRRRSHAAAVVDARRGGDVPVRSPLRSIASSSTSPGSLTSALPRSRCSGPSSLASHRIPAPHWPTQSSVAVRQPRVAPRRPEDPHAARDQGRARRHASARQLARRGPNSRCPGD